MRTVTLSSGETRPLADLSFKAALEEIKKDFRIMPFKDAWNKNLEDINYLMSLKTMRRCDIIRSLRGTSEFAGMYNSIYEQRR